MSFFSFRLFFLSFFVGLLAWSYTNSGFSLDPIVTIPTTGIILITGASTGIGRAAAEALARRAPHLTIFAGVRRKVDAVSIKAVGEPNLRPIFLDVSDQVSVARAVTQLSALGLPIVGLVNNAGVARGPTVVEFHEIEVDARSVFEVNVLGALRVTQALLPALRQAHGRVVFVSSIFGALAPPMGGIYSASKFALEALADSLRREVGPLGVSISVVRPGAVLTPIFATLTNASIAAAVRDSTPAARTYPHLHLPADLANEVRIEALAASTQVTDEAIVDALLSRRPKTRYTVANICGVPSIVLQTLAALLPDRMLDYVLSMKG
jgi:NAD(P)-dependent dehydrogenase (short-subunit alcohol dehydrogenase family)